MPKKKKSGGTIKKCFRCNEEIELIRTPSGWKPYDVDASHPHVCRSEAERTGEKMPKEFVTSRFESNRRRH
jgi:hypothetical protein